MKLRNHTLLYTYTHKYKYYKEKIMCFFSCKQAVSQSIMTYTLSYLTLKWLVQNDDPQALINIETKFGVLQLNNRVIVLQNWDFYLKEFSSVQSLSCVQLFATPWTTACQASLSICNSNNNKISMLLMGQALGLW